MGDNRKSLMKMIFPRLYSNLILETFLLIQIKRSCQKFWTASLLEKIESIIFE